MELLASRCCDDTLYKKSECLPPPSPPHAPQTPQPTQLYLLLWPAVEQGVRCTEVVWPRCTQSGTKVPYSTSATLQGWHKGHVLAQGALLNVPGVAQSLAALLQHSKMAQANCSDPKAA